MKKEFAQNDTVNQHLSFVETVSIPRSYTQQESNITQYLNSLRLSPSSPRQRLEEMNEGQEKSTKNFPSKIDVCKGQSPCSINRFSVHSSNSPIVQYYAGMTQSPINVKQGINSPDDQQAKGEIPFYQTNHNNIQGQKIQNYDFSPSAIFNHSIHNKLSNSSLNKYNPNTNPIPFVSKTLQEKIECHLIDPQTNVSKDNSNDVMKPGKYGGNNCNNNNDESNEYDSSDENQKLFMLSFHSDEEKDETGGYDGHNNYNNTYNNTYCNTYSNNISNTNNNNMSNSNNISNTNTIGNSIGNSTGNNIGNAIGNNIGNTIGNSVGNINNEEIQEIPVKPKTMNKFDNVNLQLENSNIYNEAKLLTDQENEGNKNNADYYSQIFNNYYVYPKSDKAQPTYYEQQYNPQSIKEDFSNPYMDDQSSYMAKKNKRIKRLDPESYFNKPYDVLAHNICLLSKDQGGCRYLQKKLEEDPINATNALYPSLFNCLLDIIVDPFGNYLIQKLFSTLNEKQIHEVLEIISSSILEIGSNSHGTRVIQQLINYLITPSLIEYFVSIITPFIIPLLNELNGTHIIQKFCSDYPAYGQNINLLIIDSCLSLASHRHGCCVLQKYLETFNRELHQKLLNKLIFNCLKLIVDQFGNYVIQSIFYLRNIQASNAIAIKLLGDICFYSKHKYSSNVVEKCFDHCDDATRQKLIDVLSVPEAVNDLILDEHGNYVIQKVLACSNFKTQTMLLHNIVPLFGKLKVLPFGEHIISRLSLSYPQLINKMNGGEMKNYRGGMYGKPVNGINNGLRYNNEEMDTSNLQGRGGNYNKKNYKGYNQNNNNINPKNQRKGSKNSYNPNAKQQKYK